MNVTNRLARGPWLAVVAFALATGCDSAETEVRKYEAPKEARPSTAATAPATGPAIATATAGATAPDALAAAPGAAQQIQWTAPAGWTHEPQPRPMRVATFVVGEGAKRGELIVTRFRAGGVGSLLDNINRWRQQVGLEPVTDEKAVTPDKTTVGGHEGQVYDMAGPAGDGNPPRRNRVVVVETPTGDLWFFRFFGPADVIDAERGRFEEFLRSVKFAS